ncbi:hypothetical protein CDD81_2688 [Ophiocordyceps australis]|uniref:Mitochondrial import inner membrane translocase subunit Tim21 n=1 Tax=Ophiocordyceps australis TaxID=1399860 RepID=A0A2C5YC39_9HYPO|nr:hypothetical protein CDD81_2688 [Ophiocordyceps australis]
MARPIRWRISTLRVIGLAAPRPSQTRLYATHTGLGTSSNTQGPKRRRVTPLNDDGHVPWSELSIVEKAARTTQQGFNFAFILVGLGLTGAVFYFLWTDVFSPDSKISHFNQAVNRIKKDPKCIDLLGDSKKIIAHGDNTLNKWRRARPVASSEKTDSLGNDHLIMHFHVDGPLRNGIAQLHMVRSRGKSDYEYKYLFVDIKGHERIYLERADSKVTSNKEPLTLFGVKWR